MLFRSQKIESAYNIFSKQKNISNPTGWMISCIENGYQNAWDVNEKQEGFHNFHERKYNYEQLEQELLNRTGIN